jgi:hypothetical protein
LAATLLVGPGCSTVALKRATLAHARSATDLRYKEVIENLAMTAAQPDILPAYSSIFAGTTTINDVIKATSTSTWVRAALKHPGWFATFFSTESADFTGSRTVTSNWTLDPTIVPEKIRALRAASRWVTLGPAQVGPDVKYLGRYDPASGPGYYFDVAEELASLPPNWLRRAARRRDIPHDACYWAGCGDTYVWVGPEGMEGLSRFSLILSKIARADLATSYSPGSQNRKVEKKFTFPLGDVTATLYLDPQGRPAPSQSDPVLPRKARLDNFGQYAELRSVINAAVKPSP